MAPQKPPLAIVLASSKGGQGKSTLAAALAVRAVADGNQVGIYDWEPQGSLAVWHKLRGKPENPALHPTKGDLAKDIAGLKANGTNVIIVDTPPTPMEPIERAIAAADVVVIPTRVGLFDLGGIRPVLGFCRAHNKPFLFVLNGTNPDAPGWKRLMDDALAYLKKQGPVLPKTIRERACYISALNSGKSGPETSLEVGQARAAAAEINALWDGIKRKARAAR